MAAGRQDAPRHAGQVVRRVLLRRNIVIDAETAQLAAAVQAALYTGAPSRPSRRRPRVPPPAASRCSDCCQQLPGSRGAGDTFVAYWWESGRCRVAREWQRPARLSGSGQPRKSAAWLTG
jgi:hypothetical protein